MPVAVLIFASAESPDSEVAELILGELFAIMYDKKGAWAN